MAGPDALKEAPKLDEGKLGKFVAELNKGKVSKETLGAMGDSLEKTEKLKDHKEALKKPLENFVDSIPANQNTLDTEQKKILGLYYKLYISNNINSTTLSDADLLKTVQ
jgi:hypothetical protein